MNRSRFLTVLLVVTAAMVSIATAATPPLLVNYQGVLRDPNGVPISGSRDMVFSFFDDPNAGNEILVDGHTGGGAVMVDGGLFNVALGGGVVSDGAGAGTYLDLAGVFRDFGQVWLEIEVAGETLTPRVQVLSAAYALNASNLGGKPAGQFLDTSSDPQAKTGSLTLGDVATNSFTRHAGNSIEFGYGAYLSNINPNQLFVTAGVDPNDALSLRSSGDVSAGDITIWGGGGISLSSSDGSHCFAQSGSGVCQSYMDPSQLYLQHGVINGGGAVSNSLMLFAGNSNMDFGSIDIGYGSSMDLTSGDGVFRFFQGGFATNRMRLDGNGALWLGTPASGQIVLNPSGSGATLTGQGTGLTLAAGIDSTDDILLQAGNDVTDGAITMLGDGIIELRAGDGQFNFVNGATSAVTAALDGSGNLQVDGALTASGIDPDTETILASGDRGILARGTYGDSDTGEAGRFCDTLHTGEAELADGNAGVIGYGSYAGGLFRHRTNNVANCAGTTISNEVRLATSTSAIESAAPKNFVQNHPYDPTKLVVYTSLEGDEVGTYTRGVARLQGGVARVPLGETFAWVTNPGLGLTAHVTPRGDWNDLYVESVSTSELVVRSRDGARDGVFDYLVHGLRVGFEQASVVRERDADADLPPTTPHERLYALHPELRSLSAGERFKAMHEAAGQSIDVEAGRELVAMIGVHDPEIHGAPRNEFLGGSAGTPVAAAVSSPAAPAAVENDVAEGSHQQAGSREGGLDPCRGIASCASFETTEHVEPGDVVAIDPLQPGAVAPATVASDPAVAGVVLAAEEIGGRLHALVVSVGFADLNVDADLGPIRPGDLLAASPHAGHAMRALINEPGTILGKALEPLDSGAGKIKVLLMPR